MDIESRNATDSTPLSRSPEARRAPTLGLPLTLPARTNGAGLVVDLFLLALLAIGLYFRFAWVNWNQDTDLHPDEYGLTGTLTRLSIPKSLGDYFNTRLSPVSPYNKYDLNGEKIADGPDNRMRWGQWPLLLIRWTAEQTGNTAYRELRLLGRKLSALADTLALIVIYFIGRRLYNHRVGLMAAALSGLAVMQIQQSHFMTVDTFAVLFAALAMYCAVRAAQTPTPALSHSQSARTPSPVGELSNGGRGWGMGAWLWYALFGVFCGMTVASRINLVVLFGMIFVAALIAHAGEQEKGSASLTRLGMRLALAGAAMLVTFRVTQPMSFRAETGDTSIFTLRPNPDWVDSMEVAQAESNGTAISPPAEQWTNRPALVFPFINIVLWGMGLPLGFTAWAGFLWAAWRAAKTKDEWKVHLLPLVWVGGLFLFMGTRWVKSIRYFLPIYPFLALLAAWAICEWWRKAEDGRRKYESHRISSFTLHPSSFTLHPSSFILHPSSFTLHPSSLLAGVLFAVVTLGTLAWAWGFTSIYRTDNTRLQASRWIYRNIPGPFNLQIVTPGGTFNEPLPFPSGMQITADAPYRFEFRPRVDGVTSAFTVAHARNAYNVLTPLSLHVVLAADPDGRQPLAEADLRLRPADTSPANRDERGDSITAPLGPVTLRAGTTYYFFLTAPEGGPVNITGSTITNENWDEGLPLRIEGRDGFGGLYQGLTMEIHWPDTEDKRQMFLNHLAQADYVIVPSQRRLWSASRMPANYPMTMEYYRALFDGRLGFDLVAQFQSPFVIGPLQVSDLTGTAAWGRPPNVPAPGPNYPFNDSLLAAEEAFSVYDHAPVWIFKKRADFDLEKARAILGAFDLSSVVYRGPRESTRAPTLLMLPKNLLAVQRAGGTWSEMFNAGSLLNKFQPLGVLAWYLALLVMGWLAFPLTYLAFGGLPDRGYPLAKSVALLFVAWLVWLLGSYPALHLPFTRGTIAFGFLVLAAISGLIFWMKRSEIGDYLRRHRRHLLVVEGLTLALFLFDLLIRLGNPDLWHPVFGGEKPMVFSFFNAVLKSTYFPPYDPWLAGGYINYYYYGFVIVAIPTKLLAIVPAFAYNLILPTLFSLLGTNAFCVAYNLVKAQPRAMEWTTEVEQPPLTQTPTAPALPNAYLAGLAAALLIVVLGSLGQVWFLNRALQEAADPERLSQLPPADRDITVTLNGLGRVLSGKASLPGGGRWYWDATRIVTYTNQERGEPTGNEINEFPFFTFLYADLHAHMMDMPFAVLGLGWSAAYLLGRFAQRKRSRLESVATWLVGGLALGVTRPTNTWDFPTYLALGLVAVAAAHWLRDPRLTRANLFAIGGRLLLLVGLVMALYHPFDQWFVSPYSEVVRWKGSRTAVDTYGYMYGLFLFILVTFLVWEARRWLAETPATVLTEARDWILPASLIPFALIAAVALLWFWGVPTAVIALPLMTWAGLLLLRSRATMPPEKRIVLFLVGTALAITLFYELYVIGGDRMNTIFKLGIQVWILLSVAAGAALAWVWAEIPGWPPNWRAGWTMALIVLTASAAFYTVTATSAKIKDRFPSYSAQPYGVENPACQEIPSAPVPYPEKRSRRPEDQPHSLNGMDYLRWSAYCDHTYFLPLAYDYDAIRWMQDNVKGSPVIVEAQSFDLYRLSSRYAWNTGLPNVVGWDWHQRQERGALPTEFITGRGKEIEAFYCAGAGLVEDQLSPYPSCLDALAYPGFGPEWMATLHNTLQSPDAAVNWAVNFLRKYDARYVIVGPMERAYYPPQGLAKFDAMVERGLLRVAYQNAGVTIYEVAPTIVSQ